MTTINLSTYCVRGTDGGIDLDATCEKFATDLIKFQAERETESGAILTAVQSVFDSHKGTNFNMPALANYALQAMNVQPENYAILHEKVLAFLRENSGTRESGALFVIAKGKGGGIKRWADVPADAPKA